jgi:hypothetical protein
MIERKEEASTYYENDLSAKSKAKKKRTRFQKKNEYEKRSQCVEEKTDKGKEETHSIGDREATEGVVFLFRAAVCGRILKVPNSAAGAMTC